MVVVFAVGMAAVVALVICPCAFTVGTGTLVLEPWGTSCDTGVGDADSAAVRGGPPVRPVPEGDW